MPCLQRVPEAPRSLSTSASNIHTVNKHPFLLGGFNPFQVVSESGTTIPQMEGWLETEKTHHIFVANHQQDPGSHAQHPRYFLLTVVAAVRASLTAAGTPTSVATTDLYMELPSQNTLLRPCMNLKHQDPLQRHMKPPSAKLILSSPKQFLQNHHSQLPVSILACAICPLHALPS